MSGREAYAWDVFVQKQAHPLWPAFRKFRGFFEAFQHTEIHMVVRMWMCSIQKGLLDFNCAPCPWFCGRYLHELLTPGSVLFIRFPTGQILRVESGRRPGSPVGLNPEVQAPRPFSDPQGIRMIRDCQSSSKGTPAGSERQVRSFLEATEDNSGFTVTDGGLDRLELMKQGRYAIARFVREGDPMRVLYAAAPTPWKAPPDTWVEIQDDIECPIVNCISVPFM